MTPEEADRFECLLAENKKIAAELSKAKTTINRAKDITPVVRPRANRVFKLLEDVGMGLSRVADGWILEWRSQFRKFKRLSTVWELLTRDGLEIEQIFINNEPTQKRTVISLPAPATHTDLSEETRSLIESHAIALSPSMAQSLLEFSPQQVTLALDYYKATIAKGKEIKSAAGWLLKCLKEQWYSRFVPEPSPYSNKIFTRADLPEVEVAPMPKNFWEMARNHGRSAGMCSSAADIPY